jgi:hypothetical protein
VMVVNGPLMTVPAKYRAAIDEMAAPGAREHLRSDGEKQMVAFESVAGLISNAQQGRAVVFRTVPLTFRVEHYADSGADVSIWSETLTAVDGVAPLRETWTTATYTLSWADGDWKLSATSSYRGGSEGPVPVVTQPSVETSALPAQVKGFKEYQHGAS